ncbi:unnamed protein product [Paramecium pentaurelia]|uniref:Transmembrane protein n=1 Tax=Paramecium pentaurelia TaxID=43138 RepID=A0A8S1YM50_9CILI|nr:unnamed protein product [Paramecium pentaurelia]
MQLSSNIPPMGQINANFVLLHAQSANIMLIIVQIAFLLLHQVRVYNLNEIAASAIFLLILKHVMDVNQALINSHLCVCEIGCILNTDDITCIKCQLPCLNFYLQQVNVVPVNIKNINICEYEPEQIFDNNQFCITYQQSCKTCEITLILIRNLILYHYNVLANPPIILIVLSYVQYVKNHVMNVIQTVLSTAQIQIKFAIPINTVFANLDIFHKGLYQFNVKIHVLQVLNLFPNICRSNLECLKLLMFMLRRVFIEGNFFVIIFVQIVMEQIILQRDTIYLLLVDVQMHLLLRYLLQSIIFQFCQEGYFINQLTQSQACNPSSKICENPLICDECFDGHYLMDQKFEPCNQNFFYCNELSEKFLTCRSNYEISYSNQCNCKVGYYQQQNKCYRCIQCLQKKILRMLSIIDCGTQFI